MIVVGCDNNEKYTQVWPAAPVVQAERRRRRRKERERASLCVCVVSMIRPRRRKCTQVRPAGLPRRNAAFLPSMRRIYRHLVLKHKMESVNIHSRPARLLRCNLPLSRPSLMATTHSKHMHKYMYIYARARTGVPGARGRSQGRRRHLRARRGLQPVQGHR
jgi:hypothetical protein